MRIARSVPRQRYRLYVKCAGGGVRRAAADGCYAPAILIGMGSRRPKTCLMRSDNQQQHSV